MADLGAAQGTPNTEVVSQGLGALSPSLFPVNSFPGFQTCPWEEN